MLTLQISEPHNPAQSEAIHRVLHRDLYRKGTDPYLYVDLSEYEEPRLVLLQLNQLEGVRASVYGEFLERQPPGNPKKAFEESPAALISR